MVRVFDDRGMALRSWLSVAILAGAVVWGAVEIVRVQTGAADDTGYLFGFGFLAAAAYGAKRLLDDSRDALVRLEVDFEGGQSVATLWRPWGLQRLAAPISQLSGWNLYISVKTRQQHTYLLRFMHPARPARPLHIVLPPAMTALDGLRRLAPQAIEDFEIRTGRRKAD
jgi:hypothetical protein